MGIEAKRAELKALDAEGNGSALFSLWDTSDLDGDITRKGFYGHGVQEVFMVPHHLWTSGQPPLAKGMICERPQGAVYEFEMNTELEQARSWLSHNWLRVLDTAERSQMGVCGECDERAGCGAEQDVVQVFRLPCKFDLHASWCPWGMRVLSQISILGVESENRLS